MCLNVGFPLVFSKSRNSCTVKIYVHVLVKNTTLSVTFLMRPARTMSSETVHSYSRILRRNVPYFYDAVKQHFFASVSALALCFPLTMMVSGFGPYRRLRPNGAPTECTDIIPTPWVMMPVLGFVSYRRGHELVVTPLPLLNPLPPHTISPLTPDVLTDASSPVVFMSLGRCHRR